MHLHLGPRKHACFVWELRAWAWGGLRGKACSWRPAFPLPNPHTQEKQPSPPRSAPNPGQGPGTGDMFCPWDNFFEQTFHQEHWVRPLISMLCGDLCATTDSKVWQKEEFKTKYGWINTKQRWNRNVSEALRQVKQSSVTGKEGKSFNPPPSGSPARTGN